MTKTVLINPETHLLGMNIFEIGTNKNHLNFGLMGHRLVKEMASQMDKIDSDTTHLAIPGYALDLLEEYDEKLLLELKLLPLGRIF